MSGRPPSPDRSGPPLGGAPAGRARVTVADGMALVAWFLVGQILLYGIALELGVVAEDDGPVTRFVQVSILAAVLASVLAWLGLRGRLADAWAPTRRPRAANAALGLGAGVAGFVVLLLGVGLLFETLGFDTPRQQALQDVTVGGVEALLAVTLAVVLAPVAEELVFRGAFYRGLARTTGFWPAALLTSVVFAGIHVEVLRSAPMFLIQLFLLGLLFAWLYERTGNLVAPIVAHLTFNGISMSLAWGLAGLGDLPRVAGPVPHVLVGG